jgi:hypothetical protein
MPQRRFGRAVVGAVTTPGEGLLRETRNSPMQSRLCNLKFAASAQDKTAIRDVLLPELKREVAAIGTAEAALGAYIKKTYGQ